MKSYGQLCAVARAVDVVGDRWNLLIVRELLISHSVRFTDIQRGLPGIAPNLLTQRLRDLELHGVVRREAAVAPAAGALYELTDRGLGLEGVIRELLKWGAPTVATAPRDAEFQMHWLSLPARYLLSDKRPTDKAVTVRFGDLRDGFDVRADGGSISVERCAAEVVPDAVISGPGPALVGMLQGAIPVEEANASGATLEGSPDALRRILPAVAP